MSFRLPCICNLKSISVLSGCLSMPDATSLHHCLQNHHQYTEKQMVSFSSLGARVEIRIGTTANVIFKLHHHCTMEKSTLLMTFYPFVLFHFVSFRFVSFRHSVFYHLPLGTYLGTERRHLQTRLVECRTGKK